MQKTIEMLLDEDIKKIYLGNLNTVEFDLKLPEKGKNGSQITWHSENELFLKSDGKVTRPMNGIGDRKVYLRGCFRLGETKKEKVYEVHILEEGKRNHIAEVLTLERTVKKGTLYSLPLSVVMRADNGHFFSGKVEWDEGDTRLFEECGTFHVKGKIEGETLPAELIIYVQEEDVNNSMETDPAVRFLDQGDTELIEDSALKRAYERGLSYLKSIDDDQLLYNFRIAAELDTKGAEPLEGWDSPECLLRGHTTGHYLSALALAYRESKDSCIAEKAEYMVDELEKCQKAFEKKSGYQKGYIGAYSEEQFNLLEQGEKYPNIWAPYYTLHKIMAGLLDIYYDTDNSKALKIAEEAGKWVYRRLSRLTKNQREKMWDTYIAGEFGGINETLARLYEITKKQEFLVTARMFENDKLFIPMEEKKDVLEAMHANQHIPQIIGCMELFKATGEKRYYEIAKFFWDTVVKAHIYVNGGAGKGEMFFEPGLSEKYITTETAEYCVSYNMLKLTKKLFQYEPKASYMDYYERTMWNHIAAGIYHSTSGNITYFYSLVPGAEKDIKYENSCCHGTGMESQMKYTEAIYSKGKQELYINLFVDSKTYWEEKKLYIIQKVNKENPGKIKIILEGDEECIIKIRCPYWCHGTYSILVNSGKKIAKCGEDGYIIIDRKCAEKEIEIQFSCELQEEYINDESDIAALTYGPHVLAAISEKDTYLEYSSIGKTITKNKGNGLEFKTDEGTVWKPLSEINEEKHHVYWKKS